MTSPVPTAWFDWAPRLRALCDRMRDETRAALAGARDGGESPRIDRPVARGAGDWTFGLDLPSEAVIDAWLDERAREGPLSVLTEDRGWRHRGPAPAGGVRELADFDHGGPRIALDPVDGTRNLMAGLRSAWTVVSFAPPGAGMPRLGDLTGGLLAEIPPLSTSTYRVLSAPAGGSCERETVSDARRERERLHVDDDDRCDHGYFPVFRYDPAQRPAIAALEASFFARLHEHEGADTRSVYDDQYISNGGQLACLAESVYRMIVDPRALVAERAGTTTVTSKPYDVAGAIVCARAAGAVVTAADGSELDFPLDATTPVHFAAWINPATRARLEPHWLAALERLRG